jgi:acetyl-CoA C-acetyltransferase
MSTDKTPVVVGVGQYTQPVPEDLSQCLSFADIGARAAALAMEDCGPAVAGSIDVIAAVRTFEDSLPGTAPFGRTTNLAGSVATRLGLKPSRTVYEVLGGQSPQKLVGEFSAALHRGECNAVLLLGAEVIASIRALKNAAKNGFAAPHWDEQPAFECEDRGPGLDSTLINQEDMRHGLMQPMQFYALMENARRGAVGLSRQEYRQQMGELFAPFTRVAAQNPHAFFRRQYSAAEITGTSAANPMLVEPYCRNLVSKDGVNQAAALVLTTVGKARELRIDEDRWVYLHAYSDTRESHLLEREQLGASAAMQTAIDHCMRQADKKTADIAHFDIYSCFPVVVFNAADYLGLAYTGQQLTQTGGLPYFGGPGNNYSMHGLVSLAETLRNDQGAFGFLLANGGWMSKCSVGIYSTTPVTAWSPVSSDALAAVVNARNRVEVSTRPDDDAVIETCAVTYEQGQPARCHVVARLAGHGRRCLAVSHDAGIARQFVTDDFEPLGRTVRVSHDPAGNRFRLG